MTYFVKLSESTGLVSGMAERLGIGIEDRMATPEIAGRTYLNMVMRCATCSKHGACTKLQEENLVLDAAPEYCQNADVFKRD